MLVGSEDLGHDEHVRCILRVNECSFGIVILGVVALKGFLLLFKRHGLELLALLSLLGSLLICFIFLLAPCIIDGRQTASGNELHVSVSRLSSGTCRDCCTLCTTFLIHGVVATCCTWLPPLEVINHSCRRGCCAWIFITRAILWRARIFNSLHLRLNVVCFARGSRLLYGVLVDVL